MMGWKTFNDRLALLLLVVIPVIWIVQGLGKLTLSPEVTGALIVTWTLIIQYYFRKSPPNGG
jgi:hypothetical protein